MKKGQLIVVSLLQIALVIVYSQKTQFKLEDSSTTYQLIYPQYMDVNIMIFIGFGLVKVFLKNHSFTSMAYNLLVGVWAIQLNLFWQGMWGKLWDQTDENKVLFEMANFLSASYGAATIVISFGANAGLLNSFQLIIMAVIESFIWSVTYAYGRYTLEAYDFGGPINIHIFGSCFGLAVSKAISLSQKNWHLKQNSFKITRYSIMYSLIGTLFLFVYFPSFNGALAINYLYVTQQQAYFNTVVSLIGATVTAFITSSFLNKGKFMMEDILGSVLAGGVIVASAGPSIAHPYTSLLAGNVIGIITTLGTKFLSPILSKKLNWNDSCNVLNTHFIPGFLGAFLTCIALKDSEENFMRIFGFTNVNDKIKDQITYIFVAIAVSLASGFATGLLLRIQPLFAGPTHQEQLFADEYHCKSYFIQEEVNGEDIESARIQNIDYQQFKSDPELAKFIENQCYTYINNNPSIVKQTKEDGKYTKGNVFLHEPADQKNPKLS